MYRIESPEGNIAKIEDRAEAIRIFEQMVADDCLTLDDHLESPQGETLRRVTEPGVITIYRV